MISPSPHQFKVQVAEISGKVTIHKIKLELFSTKKQMSPPFRNKKNHEIAFSYVTRGIILKINMQDLWFLCMTCRLNVL